MYDAMSPGCACSLIVPDKLSKSLDKRKDDWMPSLWDVPRRIFFQDDPFNIGETFSCSRNFSVRLLLSLLFVNLAGTGWIVKPWLAPRSPEIGLQ